MKRCIYRKLNNFRISYILIQSCLKNKRVDPPLSFFLFFQRLLSQFGPNLPDRGASLLGQIDLIKQRMLKLKGYIPNQQEILEYLNKPVDIEGEEEENVRRGKGREREGRERDRERGGGGRGGERD